MKKMKLFFAAIALLAATALQAQTVDEVIAKHIEALGGKESLAKVKSVYSEVSMEVMGNQVPFKEYLVEGKGYKTEAEFNGATIVSCLTDKSGWTINPMTGNTSPEAMPDGLYKSSRQAIYLSGGLADYAAKGYKAELAGKEGDAFKIKLSDGSSETLYFIDGKSYLVTKSLVKSEMMGQPVEVNTVYSDHKKTDFGIMIAYTRNVDMGMFQMTQKVDKIEANKEIDPKIFEMPK